MRLRGLMLCIVFAASGCGVASPPVAALEQEHARMQEVTIGHGRTQAYGQTVLAFGGVGGDGRIALDAGHADDRAWSTRFRANTGAVLPAGGHFLQVAAARDNTLTLVEAGDVGGVAPVDPAHAVLPDAGWLEVGLMRVELHGAIEAGAASVAAWPKIAPRDKAAAEDVIEARLAIGDTLAFGNVTLRVVRLQPAAGDLGGFVEFAVER